jgi:hypothetical protein
MTGTQPIFSLTEAAPIAADPIVTVMPFVTIPWKWADLDAGAAISIITE